MSTHPSPRRGLIGVVLAGLVASPLALGLAPSPASAASTSIVINEVYVNGGSAGASYTNKYVELRNLTGTATSLSSLSLQYRAGGSTGVSTTSVPLTGTIPANGYYVIQGGSNGTTTTAVPNVDQTATGFNPGAGTGGGTVSLVTGSTAVDPSSSSAVVDKLGYNGSNTPEGTAATGNTLVKSLGRTGGSVDTDANSADFAAQDPTPGATNGGGTTPPAGPLAATNPGTKNFTVNQAITPFTLAATGGTSPYTWTSTTLPAGLTLSSTGTVSGTPTATGTTSVTATATDSATPAATATTTFDIVVAAVQAVTPIAQIQGTGATSPLTGTVTTEGVVTARYPTGGLNGFYIQKPGADTPDASDAIFVYGGTSGFTSYPAIGDSVRVVGTVGEFQTATQITSTDAQVTPIASLGTVTPKTQIPGADCALPGTACLDLAGLDTAREVVEGELFQPAGSYTATDVYDFGPAYNDGSNGTVNRGEIALASNSTKPLVAPTEIIDAQATAAKNARIAYNRAHRIILDDASSLSFSTTANAGLPFPWVTATYATRVGAAVTFPAPVVFTQGFNGSWRLLPTSQVVGQPSATQPQFEQTRAQNAAPQNVGGDVKLATFNVLNFFPTTGEQFVASGGTCTYFNDRDGNRISNNSCTPDGPRGAANDANLVRQRDKIVAAINTSGADVVSLEELENSVKYNKPRDFAIDALVSALNAAAGAGTWAAVPSPAAAELPPLSEQDVIRNGFIYKPANVALVGTSDVLEDQSTGTEAFADAREPVAQAFKKVGTTDASAFALIVNHFKSKGSGTADPDGQGNANDRRILQANALVTFADQFKAARGITRVFLAGDFNAYTEEDPIQILKAAGYTNLESSSNPDEESYNFDGQVGSLDHVLANSAALADVTGVDIWEINGNESVFYEYARFNTNVTNLYTANPFRSSDHSPEIVGIRAAGTPPVDDDVNVQILATNDFHGRIANDTTTGSAGAAVLAGAVKQFKAANPATSFVAAGDLIGASTFESFIAKDKPTIDALNEAGLDVSAVGNHEFDQGYNDLVNRVMAPYNATTNPNGGAQWKYIGANVKFRDSGNPALDPSFIKNQGGIEVGYIGAVTEHLPELVAPGGISNIQVTNIVTAANAEANVLKAAGADVIVLLVHEGAAGTNCATIASDTTSDFGKITAGVNDKIDAIVSGHTHLTYNCSLPVAGWSGRAVTERPVVSAGQYGTNLNQLIFKVDPTTGVVAAKTQAVLPLKNGSTGSTFNYPVDPNTKTIVDNAVANAEVLGAQPLGQIGGAFNRAKLADGTTENRGGESTLGNLVAEIQRAQTSSATTGSAQIAFMNPGGLRADLAGSGTGAYPRTLTYKQAATVQPFANTLVNEALTGAQIKAALEQQWQPAGASRPFLKLGISKGFSYTYDPAAAQGSRIKTMRLNGTPIDLGATYSVTVNSFLSTGGDNFTALNGTARKQDTGVTDLQAQVDYFAALGANTPAPVDYSQRAVGVANLASSYQAGSAAGFDLTSLSMTGPGDVVDSTVDVRLGGTLLGQFAVTSTRQTALPGFDEVGTASVAVVIPASTPPGARELVVTGNNTGTVVRIPITVVSPPPPAAVSTTVTGTSTPVRLGQPATVQVKVTPASGSATPTGTVTLLDGSTEIGTTTLVAGEGTITVPASALESGANTFSLRYSGADGFSPSLGSVSVQVDNAATTVTGTASPVTPGTSAVVRVVVDATDSNAVPTGVVRLIDGETTIGIVELVDGAGDITVPASALDAGSNTFTLSYGGGDGFEPSTGSVTVQVGKATATVSGTGTTATYGQSLTVPVKVTSSDATTPTGTVTVRNGSTTIDTVTLGADGTGTATIAARSLPAGVYTLTLDYSGDSALEASSGTVTVTISKAASSTDASARETRVVVKKNQTRFTVDVTAPGYTPTGRVDVVINGNETFSGTLSGGVASIVVGPWTKAGTFDAEVRYRGDTNTEASTDIVSITVDKQTPVLTVTAPSSIAKGSRPTIKATLTGVGGTVPGTVRFTYASTPVDQALSNGTTSRTLPAQQRSLNVRVTYLASDNYTSVTELITIRVVQ